MGNSSAEPRAVPSSATAETKDHKEIAIHFLKQCATGDVREAFARFTSPHFLHHNPFFSGDVTALMAGMAENAKQNPNTVLEIKHAIEERELVAVHARVRHRAQEPGVALVHLFRFKDDRITEMWDIGQAVPNNSPNEYGMF